MKQGRVKWVVLNLMHLFNVSMLVEACRLLIIRLYAQKVHIDLRDFFTIFAFGLYISWK